jgi:hypothetical protein
VWFLLVLAIRRDILEDVSVALHTLGLSLWLQLIFTINNKFFFPHHHNMFGFCNGEALCLL